MKISVNREQLLISNQKPRNLCFAFCLLFFSLTHFISFSQKAKQIPVNQVQSNVIYDSTFLQGLQYRLAGPHRGGRVTAVTGVASDILTYYFGSTGGGVWKTTDGGTSWKNISDGYFACAPVGSVEVAPSDNNVVYVGTGSAAVRGNITIGCGMYKSTDAGSSWKSIGLPKAGQIGRIAIHPQNPDMVYVAALGNPFAKNEERGVFRSKDGGKSWDKVLFLNDSTGAIDLVMDIKNPRVLYAGMWRAERKSWTMIDGGHTGGLYKSIDGGDTWAKLEGGFPASGLIGKIGVAVSPVNSNRVWAIVETAEETKGGVYRSDNAGETWKRVSRDHKLRQRAWYYNHIFADTQNENTVYICNVDFFKSIDGGSSFYDIDTPHGDNHALWINPNFPDYMIQGNDGGANVSFNGGKTWSSIYNQPTSEMYRVTVDNQFPYRIYGAQQDNSTISIPSRNAGGLTPYQNWFAVAGGESGHIAVDPRNPKIVYSGNYIGLIDRIDLARGHERNVVAYPQMHDGLAGRDIKFRFQWNAPIRLSPHNPDVLYHCSQYVHKSTDAGQNWQVISPDLTTNNKKYQNIPGEPIQHDHTGVELYTTIFAFEESPYEKDVLWVGSDDGLLHLSTDAGKNWKNITPPTMPKDGTVNSIDVSPHGKGRAFVAVHKYRENNFKPYIFFTKDYGVTWKLLTDGKNGIPDNHFVRVVREDKDKEGLLYAGTEYGMYISFNEGKNWQPFQLNLPLTPITDLAVHEKDLVVATQGRSFWILDDLTPLHQFSESLKPAKENTHSAQLFKPRIAYKTQFSNGRSANFPPPAPSGAIIYFYLGKDMEKQTIKLEILDKNENVVKVFSTKPDREKKEQNLSTKTGMNRFVWNLTGLAPETVENAVFSLAYTGGIAMPTGTYTIKLTAGEVVQKQELQVLKNPNWTVTDADLQAQFDLANEVKNKLSDCHNAIKRLRDVRDQLNQVSMRATKAGFDKKIENKAGELKTKLNLLEEDLIQTRSESGQDPTNYPSKIDDQIAYLYSVVNFQDAKPTQGCYERLEDLKKELAVHLDRLKTFMDSDLKAFNEMLNKEGVHQVIAPRR
jgi:photosystem II stability/assembly factor-like uncharacterized protein